MQHVVAGYHEPLGTLKMQTEKIVRQENLAHVVEAIFAVDMPIVQESYSAFESEIQSFKSPQELLSFIAESKSVALALYYPETEGSVERTRIDLNPKKCKGHTFRYRTDGWGVIQFQVQNTNQSEFKCRFAVNSELRANKWFETYPELKPPSLWKWNLVEKHTRRLIRVLQKYAQPENQGDG